jgi:predicted amidophosphoribosyltransferase
VNRRPAADRRRGWPAPKLALGAAVSDGWAALVDLVLPAGCAGCRADRTPLRRGVCAACEAAVAALVPHLVRPVPAPPGLPPCAALGGYQGVLRELVLSYKERGRHGLAGPLGALLADVVAAHTGSPVLLVPVPGTAQAARRRHGDHVARLARHAASRLRTAGRQALVVHPLRAMPRPDSAGLDSTARAAAAATAFRVRPGRVARLRTLLRSSGAEVVVVDDIVTTGATAAAVTARLAEAGVPVRAVAVLAATARRMPPARAIPPARPTPPGTSRAVPPGSSRAVPPARAVPPGKTSRPAPPPT